METAEQMIKDCKPHNIIYPTWPEKIKPTNKPIADRKNMLGITIHYPYHEKPKKACLCAIKRQMERGKIMTAHLARQI